MEKKNFIDNLMLDNSLVSEKNKPYFICNDSLLIIDMTLVDDLVADCGPEAEDEPALIALTKFDKMLKCRMPHEMPCLEGHPKCFNIANICTYKLNQSGYSFPCRNGGHLENCYRFKCNSKFKCRNSYCIPWSYVCDGKWDCPIGDDENFDLICGNKIMCIYMFKCSKTSMICVHLATVCDGILDCPLGDDEILCELANSKCPSFCTCLLFAIQCQSNIWTINSGRYPYIYLFVEKMPRFPVENMQTYFPKAYVIILPLNKLSDICGYIPHSCRHLNAGSNSIKDLRNYCFTNSFEVRQMILSYNDINLIEKHAFFGLKTLDVLDLSHNVFTYLPNMFSSILQLKILHISTQFLLSVDKNLFKLSNISVLITNHAYICCMVGSRSICTATIKWYRPCFGMLTNKNSIAHIFIVSTLVITINVFCIIFHLLKRRKRRTKKVVHTFFTFINFNDLLYGLYLAALFIKSIESKEHESWVSSIICLELFCIVLSFSYIAQALLSLFSFSRLMVVINPIQSRFKDTNFVTNCIFFGVALSLGFSMCITVLYEAERDVVSTSVCFPFFDPTKSFSSQLATWVVVIGHTFSIVIIAIDNILIMKYVMDSETMTRKSKSNDLYLLKVQLIILTLSLVICWIPADIIYMTTMFLPQYPLALVKWTIAGIVPINSIIYPVVFCISEKSSQAV